MEGENGAARDAASVWLAERVVVAAVTSGGRLEVNLEVIEVGSLSPWHWAILSVVVIVLFGAKKLPDAARSLGKSLRIFKSEVRAMQNESQSEAPVIETPAASPTPVQSRRVDPSAATGQDHAEVRPA